MANFEFDKDKIMQLAVKQTGEHIKKKVRGVRCAEHGGTPSVVPERRGSKNAGWKITGCCQKLIDEALNRCK